MGNWDYVFPLNQEAIEWLDNEQLPHPPLLRGNRMPTTREISDAVALLGDVSQSLQIDLDFRDLDCVPGECIRIRGEIVTELRLLRCLAESCGQLWMYPDTGEIAVIVDVSIDPITAGRLWREAVEGNYDWPYFYRQMYAT
jgi:hypothetical protein